MKVTVCFGDVRVVVPCGAGDLTVSELTDKAVLRYKKAVGHTSDAWLTVHNLKSESGILDPDDLVNDVADDREQIVAIFEEQGGPSQHNGGDGTSGSSAGTSSPDMFNGRRDPSMLPPYLKPSPHTDVIITSHDLNQGSNLIVRRGSEPVMNRLTKDTSPSKLITPATPGNKRWSTINAIDEMRKEDGDDLAPPGEREGGNGQEKDDADTSFSNFARGSSRKSLTNNAAMTKWLEAQERQQDKYEMEQDLAARREPLGGTGLSGESSPLSSPPPLSPVSHIVTLPRAPDPLGIHVVPVFDANGKDAGMMIQSIESGGRVHQDGRLKPRDHITEINGTSLHGVHFSRAQEIFKEALQCDELRLRVESHIASPPARSPQQTPPRLDPPPARHQKTASLDETALHSTPMSRHSSSPTRHKVVDSKPPRKLTPSVSESTLSTRTEPVSPSTSPARRPPPAIPARGASSNSGLFTSGTNTRKIGKKIEIQLTKGANGLGFSLTTRDIPVGGSCPIYIKNIMGKGAAVEDGRLKSGDRVLQVNGEDVVSRSQSDVVSILRSVKQGEQVSLLVSRQVTEADKSPSASELCGVQNNNNLPSKAKASSTSLPAMFPPSPPSHDAPPVPPPTAVRNKEVHRLEIPLGEVGAEGLGVSVKGKTTSTERGMQDLGIYVKAVLPRGAAAKSGVLREDDQLIEVNTVSLLGKTNMEAMDILRRALQMDPAQPGNISMVVTRRRKPPHPTDQPPPRPPSSSSDSVEDNNLQKTEIRSAFKPPLPSRPDSKKPTTKAVNPVTERLNPATSKAVDPATERLSSNLRNISYQCATHDSVLGEMASDSNAHPPPSLSTPSPTTDSTDGLHPALRTTPSEVKVRPVSTVEASKSDVAGETRLPSNESPGEGEEPLGDTTKEVLQWDAQNKDVIDDSTLSPTDPAVPFSRDGFGRQSMSEKRKGHGDPTTSEFYQKAKSNKETRSTFQSATWDPRKSAFHKIEGQEGLKRASSAESLLSQPHSVRGSAHDRVLRYIQNDIHLPSVGDSADRNSLHSLELYDTQVVKSAEVGPRLGLKKSSSLESLQTAVHDDPENKAGVRGRGCNESFRAAVDHSYDAGPAADAMATVDEESSELGSGSAGGPSRGSSFNQHDPDKKLGKKNKKDKSLFKGFGQMFRLGKTRKDERPSQKSTEDLHKNDDLHQTEDHHRTEDLHRTVPPQKDEDYVESNKHNLDVERRRARHEQQRIDEQYKKLQEKQRQLEAQKQQQMIQQQEITQKIQKQEMQRKQREVQRQQKEMQQHYQEQGRLMEQPRARSQSQLSSGPPPATPSNKPDYPPPPASAQKYTRETAMPPPPDTVPRGDKIQYLRAEHQRRHRERQGQYPLDEEQERFERQMQQFEAQKMRDQEYTDYPAVPRRSRSSSRPRYSEEPDSYTHYANFQEIQEQLHRHDYYQRQYHAQYPQYPPPHYDTRPDPYYQDQRYLAPAPATDSRYDPRRHDPRPRESRSQDPRSHDPRSHDPRWSYGGRPVSSSPPRHPPAQMSAGQLGYYPPKSASASTTSLQAPPSYDRVRTYSEFDDPRSAYSYKPGQDQQFGSLPRGRDRHRDPLMSSSSAQV